MRQLVFEDQMQNPFDFKLPLSAIFVKYFIFFFNLVAFILGLVLIGTSISTAVYYSSGQALSEIYLEKYASLPIFIGIVGFFLSGLCFVGCWGAMKESWGMLMGYAISLIIVCVCLFIGGICGYVYSDSVEETVKDMAISSITKWCPGDPGSIGWDGIQESYECCGVDSYQDWADKSTTFNNTRTGEAVNDLAIKNLADIPEYPIPDSCCDLKEMNLTKRKNCGIQKNPIPWSEGCLNKIEYDMVEHLGKIAGVAVGISVFEILTIGLSFCLARHVAKKDEFYKTMA